MFFSQDHSCHFSVELLVEVLLYNFSCRGMDQKAIDQSDWLNSPSLVSL